MASEGSFPPPVLPGTVTGAWNPGDAEGEPTLPDAEAVLFDGEGSVVVEVTVAVFVYGPVALGLTTMVTVAADAGAIVPRAHVTVPVPEQLPCDAVAETNAWPAGKLSVRLTPCAKSEPLLVTVTEYVSGAFGATGFGVASLATARSAVPGRTSYAGAGSNRLNSCPPIPWRGSGGGVSRGAGAVIELAVTEYSVVSMAPGSATCDTGTSMVISPVAGL